MVTASGELDAGHYGSILLARKLVAVRGAGKTYARIYYVKCVTHKIKRGQYLQNPPGSGAIIETAFPEEGSYFGNDHDLSSILYGSGFAVSAMDIVPS
jgi:hypothetical protein